MLSPKLIIAGLLPFSKRRGTDDLGIRTTMDDDEPEGLSYDDSEMGDREDFLDGIDDMDC